MGDATRGPPVPLQASIIPPLGSYHKPLYVIKLSFAACPAAFLAPLGATLWLVKPGALSEIPPPRSGPAFLLPALRPDALSPPPLCPLWRAHNTLRVGTPSPGLANRGGAFGCLGL